MDHWFINEKLKLESRLWFVSLKNDHGSLCVLCFLCIKIIVSGYKTSFNLYTKHFDFDVLKYFIFFTFYKNKNVTIKNIFFLIILMYFFLLLLFLYLY